ncbi:MAG TPA: SCO family protein [Ramlibacter sp.]|nr:SCO family protein [Ramlibacter sp.]
MTTTNLSRRESLLAIASIAALSCAPAFAATELPSSSIYKLDAKLTDQDGREFDLASLRGQPVLASMFYSSCQMVCPMIFETIHSTLKALPEAERKDVRVLMVSFDPPRDTVAVLKETAAKRNCDSQWTLARSDETTVRKVAAVLGVQYRKLADGEFNHSTQLALLDRDGRIAAKSGKLGPADPALVKRMHAIVAA